MKASDKISFGDKEVMLVVKDIHTLYRVCHHIEKNGFPPDNNFGDRYSSCVESLQRGFGEVAIVLYWKDYCLYNNNRPINGAITIEIPDGWEPPNV